MSCPTHNNHGRSSRPPGIDPHSSSSYAEQSLSLNFTSTHLNSTFTSLDTVPNNYQNTCPTQSHGGYSYPNQAPHYGQWNAPHTPDDGQLGAHWEDAPQPVGGVAEQGIPQDPHLNAPHYDMEGYHPPIDPVAAVAPYAFHNVGLAKGIPPHGQANAPVDREYDFLEYAPQHVAPGPAQAAFHPPFVRRAPNPDPVREDNLRRLVGRLLYHPDSQVNMTWTEPGGAGRFRAEVVIVLEGSDVL